MRSASEGGKYVSELKGLVPKKLARVNGRKRPPGLSLSRWWAALLISPGHLEETDLQDGKGIRIINSSTTASWCFGRSFNAGFKTEDLCVVQKSSVGSEHQKTLL